MLKSHESFDNEPPRILKIDFQEKKYIRNEIYVGFIRSQPEIINVAVLD